MSFFAQKKKQFIRWYYGRFVNDPYAEVPMFGSVISLNALRLHAAVRYARRNKLWLAAVAVAAAVVGIIA